MNMPGFTESNGASNGHKRPAKSNNKNVDPQIIVEGTLSSGPHSDYITFRLRLLIIDLVCIVTVPEEGKKKAPVYIKFKIDWAGHQPPGSVVIDE